MPSPGPTSAHRLHDVLEAVRDSPKQNLQEAWVTVLDSPYTSPEFARRHSEVVTLLSSTIAEISALPDHTAERSRRYVNACWRATVFPDGVWGNSQHTPASLIAQGDLDQLSSVGDLLASANVGTAVAPRAGSLDELRTQCEEWLAILTGDDGSQLPAAVRDQLIGQIKHLLWLIDNASVFGAARVSHEADRFLGTVARVTGSHRTTPRWKRAGVSLMAVLTLFNAGVATVSEALSGTLGVVH